MQEDEIPPVSRFRRFSGAADIHTHPLPDIDDGSTSLEASLHMLRTAARYGTSVLVATPHRYWKGRENTPDILVSLTEQVRYALAETKFGRGIRLMVGQEIPLTLKTADELKSGDVVSIGNDRVYALVEPPFDHLPEWSADALAAIVDAGIRPILAHPERNSAIQSNPELAAPLSQAGAIFQLTAMSVTGENGKKPLATAHWLIENGFEAALASDSHSPTWRPPTIRAGYHALSARFGYSLAYRLCIANPQAIVSGKPISP